MKTLKQFADGQFNAVSDLKFLSTRSVGLRLEWSLWIKPRLGLTVSFVASRIGTIMQQLFQTDLVASRGLLSVPSREIWGAGATVLEEYCGKMGELIRRISSGGRLRLGQIVQFALFEAYGFLTFSGERPFPQSLSLTFSLDCTTLPGTWHSSSKLARLLGFTNTARSWIRENRIVLPDAVLSEDFRPDATVENEVRGWIERYGQLIVTADYSSLPRWSFLIERCLLSTLCSAPRCGALTCRAV